MLDMLKKLDFKFTNKQVLLEREKGSYYWTSIYKRNNKGKWIFFGITAYNITDKKDIKLLKETHNIKIGKTRVNPYN